MNFTKSFIVFGLASSLLIGCKDAASKPKAENSETTKSKEVVAVTKPETASFRIDGMTCSLGCAKTIQTRLAKSEGVQKAEVDFDKKEATVNFDAAVTSPEKLKNIVETTGDGETYKVSETKTKEDKI
ncbi:heavy-metal-associated domain-containing protein [Flavobacterium sp.]